MRAFALEFAARIQPNISTAALQDIADALNGSPEFGSYNCDVTPAALNRSLVVRRVAPVPVVYAGASWFVDAIAGSDSNNGSLASPFRSIARALKASRTVTPGTARAVILRAGTYYLAAPDQGGATIVLGAADSGLTIMAYPPDAGLVWVSGAAPLPALAWQRVAARPGNVWRAAAPQLPGGWPGLRFNGSRLIRKWGG